MLEVHGLDVERQITIGDLPLLGKTVLLPVSAALGGAEVAPLRALPAGVLALRLPDRLRIGAHEDLPPPALQLFSAAAVQQLIILPSVCDPHSSLPLDAQ